MLAAYPLTLRKDVKTVLGIIPPSSACFNDTHSRCVRLGAETVRIPYRIYSDEPDSKRIEGLTDTQKAILTTLYTRHANGFIREKWLAEIPADAAWQAPFVALLIGEYVAEIAERIYTTPRFDKDFFNSFVLENKALCSRITAQVITYWDLFYSGAKSILVEDPITALVGTPQYTKIKQPPELPLFRYSGYLAAEKCGIWIGRTPRKKRYKPAVL